MRIIILAFLLTGCGTTTDFFDRLEFDEDEYGCVRIQGEVNLSGQIVGGATSSVVYKKSKADPNGNVPEC